MTLKIKVHAENGDDNLTSCDNIFEEATDCCVGAT